MRILVLPFVLSVLSFANQAFSEVIFADGFEGGVLDPAWTVETTRQGRVAVRGDLGPAAGNGQLVFDDAVSDAVYSRSTAAFAVDLTGKKNAMLTFKAKSLGDEPHWPMFIENNGDFDGIEVSANGGLTWEVVGWLADVGADWKEYSIPLGANMIVGAVSRDGVCLVRFVQYDNAPAPFDGITIDDVSVTAVPDQKVIVEAFPMVAEGGGTYTGQVLLSFPMPDPLVVGLRQSDGGPLVFPSSVTIPAGEVSASFVFSVNDDTEVNPGRQAYLYPEVAGEIFSPEGCNVLVKDDEPPPVVTLTLPASLSEGESGTATLSIPETLGVDLFFTLAANPVSQLGFPSSVEISAGNKSVAFAVYGLEDSRLDGDVAVTLHVHREGMADASGQITVLDKDVPVLSLEIPVSIPEGQVRQGMVTLSDALTSGTTVFLYSDSPRVTVPAWVFIPAGQRSAAFDFTAPDDPLRNLGESVQIRAESYGLDDFKILLRVTDDEPAVTGTLAVPVQWTEGEPVTQTNAVFRLSAPLDVDQVVSFSGSSRLKLPSPQMLYAGMTELPFRVEVPNNYVIDNPVDAEVLVTCDAISPLSAIVRVLDDESRSISVEYYSPDLTEGKTGEAWVSLSGTLTRPLEITLTSSDGSVLSVPPSIVIPEGSDWASFPMVAADDPNRDDSVEVTITGSAAGYVPGEISIRIRDNDPAAYRFGPLQEIVDASNLNVTVDALNASGESMAGPTTPVSISVIPAEPGGNPVALPAIQFNGESSWTGKLVLPPLTGDLFKLRLEDAAGVIAESTPFRVMRSTNLVTKSLVWDPSRSLLFASVSQASSLHPKKIVAINPLTLEITGTLALDQEPGQLVLTGDGTWLYVVLDANARTIARINPSDLTVDKTFAVGNDTLYSYGPLVARDIMTVDGKPERLLIARGRSGYPYDAGIGIYDDGVQISTGIQASGDSQSIEPSTDPSVIYSYTAGSTYGLRRLTLGPSGVTHTGTTIDVGNVYGSEMVSERDRLIWHSGHIVDGESMTLLGRFEMEQDYYFNGVRPELTRGRVYFIGKGYYNNQSHLSAFDPSSRKLVKRLSIPNLSPRGDLLRWGERGFAFRTESSVVVMNESPLVPDSPAADLSISVTRTTPRVLSGQPFECGITVTNHGPNPAEDAWVTVNLSPGQSVSSVDGGGTAEVNGSIVRVPLGDLAVGASTVVSFTNLPVSPGPLSLEASVVSQSIDADMDDNNATLHLVAEFDSQRDQVQSIRLDVQKMVDDPTRNRVLAATSARVAAPFTSSLVSIDPLTGAIVTVASIPATTIVESMAISGNGRYLYLGLGTDRYEVRRYDLSVNPPSLFTIPLGINSSGYYQVAKDIEVLDGSGTSFMMVEQSESIAMVYDGGNLRTSSAKRTIDAIERGPTPGEFVGYYSGGLKKIQLQGNGIQLSTPTNGYGTNPFHMHASGNSLLISSGDVVDLQTRTRKISIGSQGLPCADEIYRRAYFARHNELRVRDLQSGAFVQDIPLFSNLSGYDPRAVIRWGTDGLAVASTYGPLHIIRTSNAVPPGIDADADGIEDAWALRHFSSAVVEPALDSDGDGIADALEYGFGTSPSVKDEMPVRFSSLSGNPSSQMRFRLPIRRGIDRSKFIYETSPDLDHWTESVPAESMISSKTVDGANIDLMEAVFPAPPEGRGFVRLRWKP